jgi:hypothetical protein
MQTYPLFNQAGRLFAFEIEKVSLGRRKIGSLLGGVGEVSDVKVSRWLLPADDVHVDFLYGGKAYVVWEPWGDSSRFWIGPRDESDEPIDIAALEQALRLYQPRLPMRVLGDLVSFKFLSLKRQ